MELRTHTLVSTMQVAVQEMDIFQKINSGDYFYFGEVSYTSTVGSIRAPLFYDTNNTSYYCDPSGTSKLYRINLINTLQVNGSSGSSGQVFTSNGSSAPTWQDAGGGAHTIIKRLNGANANSVQFINGSSGVTLDSTSYRGYRIVGWAIRNSGNSATNNMLQCYTGNSSGYGGTDGYYLNYRWLYSQDQQFGGGVSNGGSWAYDANINCVFGWEELEEKMVLQKELFIITQQ